MWRIIDIIQKIVSQKAIYVMKSFLQNTRLQRKIIKIEVISEAAINKALKLIL